MNEGRPSKLVIGLVGLIVTVVIGFIVPTRALPSVFVPFFDLIIFLGIGVFGWLGLVAAFRERRAKTLPP